MSLHVKGYTREVNGKLITVGEYSADRDAKAAMKAAQIDPERPSVAAQPGTYGQHKVGSYAHGRDVPGAFPDPVKQPLPKPPPPPPPPKVSTKDIHGAQVGTKVKTTLDGVEHTKGADGYWRSAKGGKVSGDHLAYHAKTTGVHTDAPAETPRGPAQDGKPTGAVRVANGGHHDQPAKPDKAQAAADRKAAVAAKRAKIAADKKATMPHERDALKNYAEEHYEAVNAALRTGAAADEDTQNVIDGLDSMMKRSTLDKDETLYRGAMLHPDAVAGLVPGATVQDQGFTSTSRNADMPIAFLERPSSTSVPVILQIQAKAGANAIDVDHHVKTNLSKDEQEVLLPRGTSFKVSKVEKDSQGRLVVHASVVPNGQDAQGGVHHHDKVAATAVLGGDVLALAGLGDLAGEAWKAATMEGLNHLILVAQNNPAKSFATIAKRPDVKWALDAAGQAGAHAVAGQITQAWLANGGPPDSPYLKALLKDVETNGKKYRTRLLAALKGQDHDALPKLMHKDALRASAGMSVAITRAKAEHALQRFKDAGITQVMWTVWSANPCHLCIALHGTIQNIGEAFDDGGEFVYHDLISPPRHPNCQCRLVPIA